MTRNTTIAIIVAHDLNRAIGWKGNMPWHFSADLKRFKRITMGHPVIMGRKTYESLPGGALPGRKNIVVSRDQAFHAEGTQMVDSPESALQSCSEAETVFVIGGATLYHAYIAMADMLYLTIIGHTFPADTWFPDYDMDDYDIVEEESIENDPGFAHPYRFITLRRRS